LDSVLFGFIPPGRATSRQIARGLRLGSYILAETMHAHERSTGARIAPPSIWPRTEPVLPIPLPTVKIAAKARNFLPTGGYPTHPNGNLQIN
jgi:hypothetical protein